MDEKRTPTQVVKNTDFTDFMHEGWFNKPITLLHGCVPTISGIRHPIIDEVSRKYLNIPDFIGIKKGEITLIWGNCEGQETTKSVLNPSDTEDFELGFLIAYYKRVHKEWGTETIRKKIVEIFDRFKENADGLKSYFLTAFYDNCLLDFVNAGRFLRYIKNRSAKPTIVIPKNFIYRTEEPKGEK